MIHLDTNFIVELVSPESAHESQLLAWLKFGEKIATSSIAWSEFLTGPLEPREIEDAIGMIENRIVAFGGAEAEKATELFNLTGRKRVTRTDCFIAATAICNNAALATRNSKHFAQFVPHGLTLA